MNQFLLKLIYTINKEWVNWSQFAPMTIPLCPSQRTHLPCSNQLTRMTKTREEIDLNVVLLFKFVNLACFFFCSTVSPCWSHSTFHSNNQSIDQLFVNDSWLHTVGPSILRTKSTNQIYYRRMPFIPNKQIKYHVSRLPNLFLPIDQSIEWNVHLSFQNLLCWIMFPMFQICWSLHLYVSLLIFFNDLFYGYSGDDRWIWEYSAAKLFLHIHILQMSQVRWFHPPSLWLQTKVFQWRMELKLTCLRLCNVLAWWPTNAHWIHKPQERYVWKTWGWCLYPCSFSSIYS